MFLSAELGNFSGKKYQANMFLQLSWTQNIGRWNGRCKAGVALVTNDDHSTSISLCYFFSHV